MTRRTTRKPLTQAQTEALTATWEAILADEGLAPIDVVDSTSPKPETTGKDSPND